MTEAERLVLMFVLDRTIGWRKVCAFITQSEFITGVRRRRGGRQIVVVAGTGLKPDRVNEALRSLAEQGAIKAERFGGKVAYRIEEDWCHPSLRALGMWELSENDYTYIEDGEPGA